MAFNLQNADHGDLRTVFERSEHEWLDYEAINAIFRSREELTVSTQPVHPIQEGLYLYPMGATLDVIDWDYDEDTDVFQVLNGPIPIQYKVVRCDDFDIEGGVKITLERRVHQSDNYGMFCVAHYRAFHNREDNSSDSGGDEGGIEAGEDDNTTENTSGDYVYVVDRAAHLAAAKAAWAMDLGRNPDTSDVAPVATKPGSSSVQDTREDMKQKQPIGTSSLHRHDNQNGEASYPKEWGGIPSKELQEAIMLEKALFNGVAKESASHNIQPGNLIESQSPDKRTVGEEPERSSTTKKAALPIEPSVENEDAITPLVRMPDSSRHGRRFLKSDKLKNLFDFIDAAGLVKPGTYRVVRSYPQRAFSLQDGALTFEELSLTNKEEALFLELLV